MLGMRFKSEKTIQQIRGSGDCGAYMCLNMVRTSRGSPCTASADGNKIRASIMRVIEDGKFLEFHVQNISYYFFLDLNAEVDEPASKKLRR